MGAKSTIEVVDEVTTVTLDLSFGWWSDEEAAQSMFREEGDFYAYAPVKVYLSHSALPLMAIKAKVYDLQFWENTDSVFHLFFEVDKAGEEDLISGNYAALAYSKVDRRTTPTQSDLVASFLETTTDIAYLIREYAGLEDYDEYKDWLEDEFDPNPISVIAAKTLLGPARLVLEAGIWALEKITPEVYNLKMPEEVWNKKKRPDDMEQWLKEFSNKVEQKIKDGIDWIKSIPKIGELPYPVSVPQDVQIMFEKVREIINGVVGMIHSVADFLREIVPNIKDTIDTMIGYVCGLWDGVVDLVGGFLDMGILLFKASLAQIKAFENLPAFVELLGEGIDEIIQGIARVNWGKVWNHIMTKTYPKFKEFLELKWEQALDNADNAGLVAYHLGYLVFTIAENFFPPLKLSRAAGLASKLSGPMQKMFQIAD